MLTTTGKINIYSMETGKFIRAMKVPNIEVSEFAMLRVQDTIAATFMRNNNGRRKERIYLSNLKGDTLQIFNRWDLFELSRYTFKNSCSMSADCSGDSVVKFSRRQLTPRFRTF